MSLSFVLHAKNSSGHQMLFVDAQPYGEVSLTLCGTHEGKDIQIDFNSISEADAKELANFITRHSRFAPLTRNAPTKEQSHD